MLEIMLDVNGLQGLYNFKTGDSISMEEKPYLDFAKKVSAEHPYPGDLNDKSFAWVTDTALEICKGYDPQLMLLSYANLNLMRVNSKHDESKKAKVVLDEALRFASTAGYEPIIVSPGNMKTIDNVLDFDEIDGYMSVSSDPYMAGIFGASEKDIEVVKTFEHVSYELRDDFIKRYDITTEYALERTPDIVLYSDGEVAFTNTGGRGTTLEMMIAHEDFCTAYTTLPNFPTDIFEVRTFVDDLLSKGKRIAIIITEGVDEQFMPKGSIRLNKKFDGIVYAENVVFYYALLNAKKFNEAGMPYIFHNPFVKHTAQDRYPFSYTKTGIYGDPIGFNREFKTASMGSRSGIFHSACMCDYSFECHCRGLAESGVLTFINADKFEREN